MPHVIRENEIRTAAQIIDHLPYSQRYIYIIILGVISQCLYHDCLVNFTQMFYLFYNIKDASIPEKKVKESQAAVSEE